MHTGDSPPISQQKYRTPYYLRNELKKIIDRNVETGLMEECSSPWAAPTLLVKKASGAWRLVCDFRALNRITTADAYPLPEISDCVNELAESRIFTTTDLCSTPKSATVFTWTTTITATATTTTTTMMPAPTRANH